MHSILTGSEMHRVAQLTRRDDRGLRDVVLLEPLFHPELVTLGTGSLLLRGFESIDGAVHVQEWHCMFVGL